MGKLFKTGLLLSSAVLLAACGSDDGGQESGGDDSDRTLIVYSNAVSDGRGDYLQEAATEAGFDIQFVDLGGTELLNRIIAEKDAPVADVVFGLNDMNFEILRAEEILEAYEPVWIDEIADDVQITEDNLYNPVTLARVFPIYNADEIDAADAPTSYEDLHQNSEYHQQYRVQGSLNGATDTAAMYTQLVEFRDEEGEMGVSEEGWNNLEAYFNNGYQTPEGEDWVQNLVNGDVPIAYTWMANVLNIEDEYGINIGIVDP